MHNRHFFGVYVDNLHGFRRHTRTESVCPATIQGPERRTITADNRRIYDIRNAHRVDGEKLFGYGRQSDGFYSAYPIVRSCLRIFESRELVMNSFSDVNLFYGNFKCTRRVDGSDISTTITPAWHPAVHATDSKSPRLSKQKTLMSRFSRRISIDVYSSENTVSYVFVLDIGLCRYSPTTNNIITFLPRARARYGRRRCVEKNRRRRIRCSGTLGVASLLFLRHTADYNNIIIIVAEPRGVLSIYRHWNVFYIHGSVYT